MEKCLVLIATYNGEKYLRELIESVLAQEGVEIEIACSDDCSTDGTQDILKEYSEKLPNFSYYINKENKRFTLAFYY